MHLNRRFVEAYTFHNKRDKNDVYQKMPYDFSPSKQHRRGYED